MDKKYKLTKTTKVVFGIKLFQIEAVVSFGGIEKGELGGYIEKEKNLDQAGDARVSGDAWVSGNARVSGNAWVYGDARVSGNAWVYGKLKLEAGSFFGMQFNKEEIKYHTVDDSSKLIYKGDAIFGKEITEIDAKKVELLAQVEIIKKQIEELDSEELKSPSEV